MARFQHTASFAGKGQKDLKARVVALMAMGEPEPPRNPDHPHLYLRTAVRAAEVRRGLEWRGAIGGREAGYVSMPLAESR